MSLYHSMNPLGERILKRMSFVGSVSYCCSSLATGWKSVLPLSKRVPKPQRSSVPRAMATVVSVTASMIVSCIDALLSSSGWSIQL